MNNKITFINYFLSIYVNVYMLAYMLVLSFFNEAQFIPTESYFLSLARLQ